MTADWVRQTYNVPAKRGMRVAVHGKPGTIISFPGPYLGVRFDGENPRSVIHPTDGVVYDTGHGIDGPEPASCGNCGQHLTVVEGTPVPCDRPLCQEQAARVPALPNYAVAPGEYLQEFIDDGYLTREAAAAGLGYTDAQLDDLLTGRAPITDTIADTLASLTALKAAIWLSKETQYREDLERLR